MSVGTASQKVAKVMIRWALPLIGCVSLLWLVVDIIRTRPYITLSLLNQVLFPVAVAFVLWIIGLGIKGIVALIRSVKNNAKNNPKTIQGMVSSQEGRT